MASTMTFAMAYYPAYDGLPDMGPLNPLATWWQGLLARTPRPAWGDIRFRDLRGHHGRMVLMEVLPDRDDMVISIVGEGVRRLMGMDYGAEGARFARGDRLTSLLKVAPDRQKAHVTRLMEEPAVAHTRGFLELSSGRQVALEALDFPLPGADDSPGHVLALYHLPGQGMAGNMAGAGPVFPAL